MTTRTTTTSTDGSLYLNKGRGCWELAHIIGGKRYIERVPRKGRTDAECKAECRRRRNERRSEVEANAGLTPGSMAWLADKWVTVECKGLAAGTIRGARWAADIVTAGIGTVPTNELNLLHVQELLGQMADEGKRPATISKVRSALHQMCAAGIEWGALRSNPVASLRRTPKGANVAKAHRWYNLDEYETALSYITDPDNHDGQTALVATLMLAGLRSQEARALRWTSVDWQRGVLRITEAVKAVSDEVGATKSKAGYRVVPMAPELVAVLRRQAEAQMAEGRSEYVFAAEGTYLTHEAVTAAAAAFARQTGLGYINPHGFRHTFASIALHRGIGYEVLAKLMGHGDVSQLIKTYGHVVVAPETIDMSRFAGADTSQLREVVGG